MPKPHNFSIVFSPFKAKKQTKITKYVLIILTNFIDRRGI